MQAERSAARTPLALAILLVLAGTWVLLDARTSREPEGSVPVGAATSEASPSSMEGSAPEQALASTVPAPPAEARQEVSAAAPSELEPPTDPGVATLPILFVDPDGTPLETGAGVAGRDDLDRAAAEQLGALDEVLAHLG